MSRPASVFGLLKKLTVARWNRLSTNGKFLFLAIALLTLAAVVGRAFFFPCPARSCCRPSHVAATEEPNAPVLPSSFETTTAAPAEAMPSGD